LDQVESALEGIVEKYRSEFYPFEVRESGGGWQFLTKRDYHKTVAQLNGEKFLKRLSTAALEALSIVAYKQPVTKAEIEAIRGVSSDYAIQKLLEKELIVITGRNEKMPGHPLVYGTSKNFMDYFGINSAEDLPKLKEVFDETMVNATNVTDAIAEQAAHDTANAAEAAVEGTEDATVLVVAENGELIEGIAETAEGHLNGEAVDFVAGEEDTEEETPETEDSAEEAEEETEEEESADDEAQEEEGTEDEVEEEAGDEEEEEENDEDGGNEDEVGEEEDTDDEEGEEEDGDEDGNDQEEGEEGSDKDEDQDEEEKHK
jgi:segregation and condensation protein B